MKITSLEVNGFKSFAKKTSFTFSVPITAVVGPNGSGKSNVTECFRFVLGEQSMKSMRGKRGEDLIWSGSPDVPRLSRASVKLVCDNRDKALPIDYDEVIVERIVYRDGQSEYLLNGSQVRLKDVQELFAKVNIGASGHHIASQGEADHMLSASPKERRGMVEDALGLTSYQYQKIESERKLFETRLNMEKVESMKRELEPHLRYLKRQVEKAEKAEETRKALANLYVNFFAREDARLSTLRTSLTHEQGVLEAAINALPVTPLTEVQTIPDTTADLRAKRRDLSRSLDEKVRALSRLEGELAVRKEFSTGSVAAPDLAPRIGLLRDLVARAQQGDATALTSMITVIDQIDGLLGTQRPSITSDAEREARLALLTQETAQLTQEMSGTDALIEAAEREMELLRTKDRMQREAAFAQELERREQRHKLAQVEASLTALRDDEAEVHTLRGHAAAQVGSLILSIEPNTKEPYTSEERREARREIDRLAIRLEESGVTNADELLKEHGEMGDRHSFLEKELHDLTLSAAHLDEVIAKISTELTVRFESGIHAINTHFNTLFGSMFPGGKAALVVVVGEDDGDKGVDIDITVPHKRVRSLTMLSGGERSLTSIALLFALAQVTPPPFVILDETDAALDEANSRRFGDLLVRLAEKAQLIVVTHNRETMSRAGLLYGVTMGRDGVSKTLMVSLEDAEAVAK